MRMLILLAALAAGLATAACNTISGAGQDVSAAGEAVSDEQLPSMGCSIKWADGNQPAYFG